MAHSKGKYLSSLACSFCGKPQPETRKLIAGPTAYICDECVYDALAIIRKDEAPFVAELDGTIVLTFLQQHLEGRPLDSVTIGELVRRYEEVRAAVIERSRPQPVVPLATTAAPRPVPTIEERELTAFLSRQYGVPAIDLDGFEVSSEVSALIHEGVQRRHCLVPVNLVRDTLIIAMANPSSITAIDDVKFHTGYSVEVVVASEAAIRRKIDKHFPRPA
ncbi:hypothetical protein HY635_03655 [Candidatus Uhrbacteria bacterium]|nr:hypothetical protein [Candidatus Uhrbacteria bacterium]